MNKALSILASIAFAFIIITIGNLVIVAQDGANKPPDMAIDSAMKSETIEVLLKELNDKYVFPDVAKKIETDIRARQKNKEYDAITSGQEFAKKLTEDLQLVSRDKHMRMRFSAEPMPVREKRGEPTEAEKADYYRKMKINNYGFVKIENMRGNIGYIDFRGFMDPEAGAETVAAAMNFVSNSDALIFDMRQNGGGDPAMVALICSYLFGDKVHLNDLYWRRGK